MCSLIAPATLHLRTSVQSEGHDLVSRDLAVATAAWECVRIMALVASIPNAAFVPTPIHIKGGILLTPKGGFYCANCAPSVQVCRECGCTDEAGCIDGCWWEEADLCSQCSVPAVRPYVIQSGGH